MSRIDGVGWTRGFTLAVLGGLAAAASATADAGFATLEAAGGDVVIVRQGQPQAVARGMALERNDVVVTKRGRATVRFSSDGTIVRVGPDSRVQVDETATQRDVTAFFGRLWAHVVRWKERPTRFTTAGTIAAVRGTELSLAVATDGDRTELAVLEGKVEARNDAGALELVGGQSATARKGTAPARGVKVRPKDAVQWAFYYPPVLAPKAGETVPAEGVAVTDARLLNLRAAQLLAAGSVDAAEKDLEQAEKLAAGNSDTLALQSVVAVARTENEKALSLAKRAAAADAKSTAAQIAMTYAQQAAFDLEGARASADRAVALAPADALAWARVAEIRSSLGDLGGALVAARKAAELAPDLSRAQTVLGFAHLTQVRTGEARVAFEKAIALDSSDPLPRLGLGLARIREGDVSEGSQEIEVAVSLDPGQSLLRSYLGKAYFEAKRGDLVGREYELAKEADPKDPTPYLYDAIAKQTTNRPVEALDAFQEAIERNDNRAVYRSRLLLDADLAARSASLGRLYADLGFQDRALVEGWTSVNTDPTNYSAHRFLADSYAALPRHEIARVSELLQSQLLQPLNTTPIQPRLGESNLFLISSGGPGALSFNEFNPLFNRDGVNLQASGVLGENGLWTGDGVLAGIYKKLSFSVGYNQFETDGWRVNSFQKDKIANAFVQLELSPKASIQAEYRYRDQQYGDLQQKFFSDVFLPGESHDVQKQVFRLGGRLSLSPGSTVLASVSYAKTDDLVTIAEFFGPETSLRSKVDQESYSAEAQYLFRSRYLDVTGGVGYFNIDGETLLSFQMAPGFEEEQPPIPGEYHHVNVYAYGYVKPHKTLTLTAGASYDSVKGDLPEDERDQFNPKLGLVWKPLPGTTLRAAAFKTLKRTLITDQTLEPTQVGGFNQFYDDADLTEAWRYGGGIDQKLGGHVLGGLEYSVRDLDVPLFGLDGTVARAAWDESLARAYLFATPHRWFAVRASYIREDFERPEGLGVGVRDLRTDRLPVGVGFFHPSGVTATATATWWRQEGEFQSFFDPTAYQPGESKFWLVDATFSYRLPKRYGFVSVGVTNLFDEEFEYFEVDPGNVTIQPARTMFARVTLAIP
jgi:tetratricopeptide (TPR) repeat protein